MQRVPNKVIISRSIQINMQQCVWPCPPIQSTKTVDFVAIPKSCKKLCMSPTW